MSQVRVCFDGETQTVDFAVNSSGAISLDGGLETSSLYSTLIDRRSPDNTDGGYWADQHGEAAGDQWGSLHWFYVGRSKISADTIRNLQTAIQDSHQWMLDVGIASAVDIPAPTRPSPDVISVAVNIVEPNGDVWQDVWKVHRNAV